MTMMTSYKDELYHHGVKGQKWGDRNGPPYPLSSRNHSTLEKRAGWRKSLDKNSSTSDNKYTLKLSVAQKKAIKIGLAAVGVGLATYGAYKFGSSGAISRLAADGRSLVNGFDVPTLQEPETHSDSLKAANPHESTRNCGRCVLAYFARQLGYDMVAPDVGQGLDLVAEMEHCFTFPKPYTPINGTGFTESVDKAKRIVLRLAKSDDASGAIGVSFKDSGDAFRGHAFAWRIENGNVSFFDPQKGVDYDDAFMSGLLRYIDPAKELSILRLDNAQIKPEALPDYLVRR